MRQLAPADLAVAARALLQVPEEARIRCAEMLLSQSQAADAYRKRFGRAHPLWGDGTLESVARGRDLAPAQPMTNSDYLSCMAIVLEAVLSRETS